MTQRRWWQSGSHSVEEESTWFHEDGLEFALDQEFFDASGIVVFEGELRLDDRRVPAKVLYPPSYDAGGHPSVIAPELPVERHRTPAGFLCLDHPVLGEDQPMCGAEAVQRAERLWYLWENDRKTLQDEEADAPDPAANYYDYEPETAVVVPDIDVGHGTEGFFRLQATRVKAPLRAVVTEVRVMKPAPETLSPGPSVGALEGVYEVNGAWKRVDHPPPFTVAGMRQWLEENHRGFFDRQIKFGRQQARASGVSEMPTVLAFVYPNEGPGRGESHDEWLFVVVDHETGNGYLVRAFALRGDERWLRQPQLQPLGDKRITVVGVGALGSQVANLLAQAGVGRLTLVDYDFLTHGNRIRHQLDLRDIGREKVRALKLRLLAVNPWCSVDVSDDRFGFGLATSDDPVFERIRESDLLINATAHSVTGRHLSRTAFDAGTRAVHTWVSAGAWGGRVLVHKPGQSACVECLGLAQNDARFEVPEVSEDPDVQEVSENGCADVTFTGPGFELAEAAAATARIAVQMLMEDDDRYPVADFDLATLKFRDATTARAATEYTELTVHPDCSVCAQTS